MQLPLNFDKTCEIIFNFRKDVYEKNQKLSLNFYVLILKFSSAFIVHSDALDTMASRFSSNVAVAFLMPPVMDILRQQKLMTACHPSPCVKYFFLLPRIGVLTANPSVGHNIYIYI